MYCMYIVYLCMHLCIYLLVYLFIYSLANCQVGQVGLLREKGLDIGRHPLHHINFPCSSGKVHLCKIPYFADYYRELDSL